MKWTAADRVKAKRPTSAQCLVKFMKRIPRVGKAVIKVKGGSFELFLLLLFHTFLNLLFNVYVFIVLMPSVRLYNVNSHENKKKSDSHCLCSH